MGISKTSDHIQIRIKMPNPSQEHPISSKALNQDLKDMDFLCMFKIKKERAKIWIIFVLKTSDQRRHFDFWTQLYKKTYEYMLSK